MLKPSFCLMIAVLTLAPLSQARALCIHNGELYAKTTMTQEFAESRWVVRARVASQTDGQVANDGMPWTIYHLEVLETFKGTPPSRVKNFTWRNSGGFYLEPESGRQSPPGEYLLFLVPAPITDESPREALGSVVVNYSCGQSKAWSELGGGDIAELHRLSGRP